MFKKIKVLLLTGVLSLCMCANAFAENSELPASGTSVIEYPDFGDFSFKDYSFQDGNIILTLYKDSNGYRANIKWVAENFKVTGIKMIYEDGSFSVRDIMLPGEAAEGQDCYIAVPDGDHFKVAVNDGVKDKKLVKVEVMFKNLTKDDEPVPPVDPEEPPVEEEEKVDDPETGDISIIPIVGIAVVSAAGLFVLNKKDDEE